MKVIRRRRSDERGAILIMSVVGMVIAVLAAALAVDLGSLAAEKRSDQKVADLASLDAVRGLNDWYIAGLSHPVLNLLSPKLLRATRLAEESAVRNGYDPSDVAAGHNMVVSLGVKDTTQPKNFRQTCPLALPAVPDCVNVNAVKVEISSNTSFSFRSGDKSVTVSAVAFQDTTPPTTTAPTTTVPPTTPTTLPPSPGIASFSIGSSLVNLSTSSSALLNPIIGSMIGGDVSAVSWSGLASGGLTLSALQTELVREGFSVGSVSALMEQELTLAELYHASAEALRLGGPSAAADIFDILEAQASVGATLKLSDLIEVATGTPDSAVLGTSLNLLQLVTGSAEVINGTSTVSVPNVAIDVPGVSKTNLTVKVTQLPQVYIGPVGGSVSTGQVSISVTTSLDLDVRISALSVVRVTGDLPVGIQGASATGTLTAIQCSSPNRIVVSADPSAFSGAAEVTTLRAKLLGLNLLDIQTTSVTPNTDGNPATALSFNHTSQFAPPVGPGPFSQHVGSSPIGLKDLTQVNAGTVTVLGTIPLGLNKDGIAATIMTALKTVLQDVDNSVLTPLLTALGVDVGGADVTALGMTCPVIPPVITTTTTLPPPSTTTTTTLPPPAGAPSLIG